MSRSDFYESSNSLEEKCVFLANKLILHCKGPYSRIQCLRDINSELIVLLFENITNHTIPDLLCSTNKEEEAHNMQAVIDTLSLDLLGISLSHITGEDVVAGNLVAICNLLEVLEGIVLHLRVKKGGRDRSSRVSLKRKLCKRKNSIIQRKSKSSNYSSNGLTVTKIEESETSESTSGTYTFPRDSKTPTASPNSVFKKSTDISVKNHFTQERNLSSEYPISSRTASSSHASTDTKVEKSTLFCQRSHLEEETDHTTYPKKVVQQLDSEGSSKLENKPHFQIEKVEQNKTIPVYNEISSLPVHFKKKISKHASQKKVQTPVKKEQEVEELFEKNLEKKVRVLLEKNGSNYYSRASRMKRLQLQNLQKPIKKTTFTPCRKSFLLPHSLRRRSIRQTSAKRTNARKNNNPQIHKKPGDEKTGVNFKTGFIQELFEEFPGLQLPPQIANHIRKKYQIHLLKLHKQVKSCLLKKPKSQLQAAEVAKRQDLLSELLKKNILEEQYLRESRENRKYGNAIKYRLRDARLQSAKMKQYTDEFHIEMRKKMQKRNFTEEMILEKVFLDALEMQKKQVNYLCEEVKEAEENDAKQHLAYLDTLENLYQTQFAMLSEALFAEKKDKQVQVKAREKDIRSMQNQFQEELKKEIRFMQKVILECSEDTHFREMDAELYREKLRERYL